VIAPGFRTPDNTEGLAKALIAWRDLLGEASVGIACTREGRIMNLTEQQLDDATAGRPVRLEIPGRGIFFLVNVGFFERIQKVRSKSSERDPELEAFLDLAEEEADRIATENPY
jgi:hypothetical protein